MDTSNFAPLKSADKIVGILLAVGALLLGGTALFFALPILIELAKNTIIFVGELAVLALLLIVGLDKNTWLNIYYGWRNVSRKIRKAIIREDPIGILDSVSARFATKLEEIDENINKVIAAFKRQTQTIAKAERASQDEVRLAEMARREGKELQVKQHATAAARWQTTADEMRPMEETLLNVKSALERARDLCASRLADLQSQKQVMTMKLDVAQSSGAAVKSFKKFFGSNPDLDMLDLAVEEIERQSTEAEAEMEQFIRVMNPMLDGNDLKASAEALAAMEKFNLFTTSQTKALPEALPVIDAESVQVKELVERK